MFLSSRALFTKLFVTLVLVTALFIGFLTFAPGGYWWGGTPVAFEVVDQGVQSTFTERRNFIIRTADEWRDLWTSLHAGDQQAMPIDFSASVILALFQGQKSTEGYSVGVTRIEDISGALEVFIEETEPGAGCQVAEVNTSPYQLVLVKKMVKTIVSKEEKVVEPCAL